MQSWCHAWHFRWLEFTSILEILKEVAVDAERRPRSFRRSLLTRRNRLPLLVQGSKKELQQEKEQTTEPRREGQPKQICSVWKSEVCPFLWEREVSIGGVKICQTPVGFGSGAEGPSGNPFMNALSPFRQSQSFSGKMHSQSDSSGSQDFMTLNARTYEQSRVKYEARFSRTEAARKEESPQRTV